ncbi:MAG: alpha/beta fold hydrolase [Hymenobacteraceae bacterium]|nr:alpha/beta fold hydrolase [Hymenobacteraceae bacterium]MDX5397506.1 alpha/beta fold hydrolase [Hymenobacteraceae bacterium]MDX5513585.1 alpha/beta fold hydrolase [Hymenobacteraceae bacterium]
MSENKDWLNKTEYPFQEHYLKLDMGKLHYIDKGKGEPIVFVHGTPVWSFVWRKQIKLLSKNFRCIAPDHIGFGLSDKPANWTYTPEAHAQNLEKLIEHLQLTNLTLVVHDFGGPIGLYYALNHPENVKRVVLLNTWMWSLRGEKNIELASKLFSSGFGRFLYKQLNFSAKYILKSAFYDKTKLTPELHKQYKKALANAAERTGTWRLSQELVASGKWFNSLWEKKEVLKQKPCLIVWGKHDPLIPVAFLEKWKQVLPQAKVIELPAGHFIQEEAPDQLNTALQEFIKNT